MTIRSGRARWWASALVISAVIIAVVAFGGYHRFGESGAAAQTTGAAAATESESTEQPAAKSESGLPAGDQKKAVSVTVASISVRPVQRSVSAVGSFFGYEEVTVSAKVAGTAIKVYRDVGDVVRPGDPLVDVDPTDYELAVNEGRRGLELDLAKLGVPIPPEGIAVEEVYVALREGKIDIDRLPTVVRAKEQMQNAQSRLDRVQRLRESNSTSEEEVEQRKTDLEVARTTFEQTLLDARAAKVGVAFRLASLRTDEQRLKDSHVVAPMPTPKDDLPKDVEYVVAQRKISEGEMIKDSPSASSAVFELVMDGVLKLMAAAPERYLGQVREGQKVEVRVEAYSDRVFEGTVRRINPMIDRNSRTFQIEIHVPNPKRELKAGGFAKADILTHVDGQAWTVPAESIVSFVGSTKIFVIRNGQAHVVPVVRGLEGRDWVEIVRSPGLDLRPDDRVITSGYQRLAEGVAVVVRDRE